MEEKTNNPTEPTKKRGRKKDTIVDVANERVNYINFMESFGTIIFKNGVIIKVRKMFEYFHQNWGYFMTTLASGNQENIKKMMSVLDGGVITNGEMTINLMDVSAMVAVHQMMENDGRKRKATQPQIDDDDEALRNVEFD